jgi:hypothetical protein
MFRGVLSFRTKESFFLSVSSPQRKMKNYFCLSIFFSAEGFRGHLFPFSLLIPRVSFRSFSPPSTCPDYYPKLPHSLRTVVQCTVIGKMAGTIPEEKRNDRRAGEKETEKEGRRLLKRRSSKKSRRFGYLKAQNHENFQYFRT